jgi:hypothetical protein
MLKSKKDELEKILEDNLEKAIKEDNCIPDYLLGIGQAMVMLRQTREENERGGECNHVE